MRRLMRGYTTAQIVSAIIAFTGGVTWFYFGFHRTGIESAECLLFGVFMIFLGVFGRRLKSRTNNLTSLAGIAFSVGAMSTLFTGRLWNSRIMLAVTLAAMTLLILSLCRDARESSSRPHRDLFG
jgi:hypothetical protein